MKCGGRGGGECERGGGVWERWRCVTEVEKWVVGLEVCGRGGGVWERWRCVRVETYGGRVRCAGEVEMCGRGGGVWRGGGGGVCGRGGGV